MKRHSLQRSLDDLERTDSTVRAAAKKLDDVKREILSKPGPETEEVPDSQIAVGDMVDALGWKRVTAIKPYTGPLDFVIGIAETVPGTGFSLTDGGYTKRVKR